MLAALRSRLTYANVMATVAVFVALGGTSYAALTITGKQVRNNSLTGKDIKNLKSADVANRSLLAEDFRSGALPQGPQGPQGPTGPAGAPGAPATKQFAYIRWTAPTAVQVQYGAGVTSVARVGTGEYEVAFTRDVAGCAAQANPGTGAPVGDASLNTDVMAALVLDPDTAPGVKDRVVHVFMTAHDGTMEDSSFMISLFC
jgi:hypothetical protein